MEWNGGRRRFALIFAYVATVIWATSFLLNVFIEDYSVPPLVQPIVLIVAGWAYREALPKLPSKKKEPEDDH